MGSLVVCGDVVDGEGGGAILCGGGDIDIGGAVDAVGASSGDVPSVEDVIDRYAHFFAVVGDGVGDFHSKCGDNACHQAGERGGGGG